MTRDEAYKELREYRSDIVRMEGLSRHIRELRGRMYNLRIGGTSEPVQGGGNNETLEKMMDEINRYAEKYGAVIIEGEEKRKHIEEKLQALSFPYGEVLRRKYIEGESYEKIAVEMTRRYRRYYSYENVRQLAKRGVDDYSQIE